MAEDPDFQSGQTSQQLAFAGSKAVHQCPLERPKFILIGFPSVRILLKSGVSCVHLFPKLLPSAIL